MALIVETGSIVPNADAYADVAYVDTYEASYKPTSAWTAANTTSKEVAIRQATQYIDSFYRGLWSGLAVSDEQSLAWPRYSAVDAEGFTLASDTIPEKLKQAMAEAALRAISGTLLGDQTTPGGIKKLQVKVGPLMKLTEYAGSASQQASYPMINNLLAGLIISSPDSGIVRLIRG